MTLHRRTVLSLSLSVLALAACGGRNSASDRSANSNLHPGETPQMRALVAKWAAIHDIPPSLLHRQIQRESGYNPGARNGPYYGLLQVLPQTAQTMGYRGPASGLLDAETNLEFAGRYLKGAWIVSGGNEDRAMMWFAKGYYYEAKRKGLLEEMGLRG